MLLSLSRFIFNLKLLTVRKEKSSDFVYIFNISHSSEKDNRSHIIIHVIFFLQFKIYNIIIYYYNSYNMR